jgi:hypothetical protein
MLWAAVYPNPGNVDRPFRIRTHVGNQLISEHMTARTKEGAREKADMWVLTRHTALKPYELTKEQIRHIVHLVRAQQEDATSDDDNEAAFFSRIDQLRIDTGNED